MQAHQFVAKNAEPLKPEIVQEQAKLLKEYHTYLAKAKFYGTISLKYEGGVIQLVENHSNSKPAALAKSLEQFSSNDKTSS